MSVVLSPFCICYTSQNFQNVPTVESKISTCYLHKEGLSNISVHQTVRPEEKSLFIKSLVNKDVVAGIVLHSMNSDIESAVSQRLERIKALRSNWDGYGAVAFSHDFLDKIKEIIAPLSRKPEIFPISDGSIQLEYDGPSDSYLEIVISDIDSNASVFMIDREGQEHSDTIQLNHRTINNLINNFYG